MATGKNPLLEVDKWKLRCENCAATKYPILAVGVHKNRATSVSASVHDSIVDTQNEAMPKWTNEAIEVPIPLLQRSTIRIQEIRATTSEPRAILKPPNR